MDQETTSPLERLLRHPDVDCWPVLKQVAIKKIEFLDVIERHCSSTGYNQITNLFEIAVAAQNSGFAFFVADFISLIKQEMGEKAALVDYKALHFILDNQPLVYWMSPEDADLQQAFFAVIHPQLHQPQIYQTDPPDAYRLYRQALASAPQPTA